MGHILGIMKQKRYVLLGDVIHSRRISDRDDFQKKVEEACNRINTAYTEDVYADFKILKGVDEVGGVLSDISNIYKIITTILEEIYPNVMRFVLVFGYIDTAIETGNVAKMDGSAFHKASEMMHGLKNSKLIFDMSVSDKMIDATIAGQINLILLIKRNWSARQHRVIREYERSNNQSEVAKNLEITQQAVSKTLNRSMWREIRSIGENLNFALRDYMQRLDAGVDNDRKHELK